MLFGPIATRPGPPTDKGLPPTLPYNQPGQPPDQASHQTLPPACLPCLPACPTSLGTAASRTLRFAIAVLVLLQRLYVWHASQMATASNITPHRISYLPPPPPIFYIPPPQILCTLSSNILCSPSKLRRISSNIIPISTYPA